jgi:hypothetical protein
MSKATRQKLQLGLEIANVVNEGFSLGVTLVREDGSGCYPELLSGPFRQRIERNSVFIEDICTVLLISMRHTFSGVWAWLPIGEVVDHVTTQGERPRPFPELTRSLCEAAPAVPDT